METILLYLWLIPFILFLLMAIYVGFSDGDGDCETCAFLIFIGFIPVLNLIALAYCIINLIFER